MVDKGLTLIDLPIGDEEKDPGTEAGEADIHRSRDGGGGAGGGRGSGPGKRGRSGIVPADRSGAHYWFMYPLTVTLARKCRVIYNHPVTGGEWAVTRDRCDRRDFHDWSDGCDTYANTTSLPQDLMLLGTGGRGPWLAGNHATPSGTAVYNTYAPSKYGIVNVRAAVWEAAEDLT